MRRAGGRVVTRAPATTPDLVVDGIVGIGGRPGLRDDAVAALTALQGVPVVAVDVPSGVDVDTGELAGPAVRADVTVTFGTHKVALLADPAAAYAGVVHLVDIGLETPPAAVEALQSADVAALLPRPVPDAQKYSRGVVGVRAGSAAYPGAGVLCVAGAASGLCGMVRYAGGAGEAVLAAHPDVVAGTGQVQAWTVGSGGGVDVATMLAEALGDGVPTVIDADALALVDEPLTVPAVLTPHAGELARMTGADRAEIEAAPLRHARAAAERYAAVVLLKGRRTVVARPDGSGQGDHHRRALAGHGGRRRRAGRTHRRAARRGPGPVRRSVGRVVAARRRCDRRFGRWPALGGRRGAGTPGRGARPALKQSGACPPLARPEIVVDLGAIRHNVRTLADLVAADGARMMTVVKADGYGHGLVESGRAARDAGADWLGVATVVRGAGAPAAAGDTGRLLCWLTLPADVADRALAQAVAADVDVTAYTVARLDEIVTAGESVGVLPRVQLKVDTGLSRGGAPLAAWADLVAAAAAYEQAGRAVVTGVWSHFACSDEPEHPANDLQEERFRDALRVAEDAGLRPRGPPPRQLGGRDPAAVVPLRPGALRHRVLRPRPGSRR